MDELISEIQILKEAQNELILKLEDLREAEAQKNTHKGTWLYVVGGIGCIVLICGAIYMCDVDIKGSISSLGDSLKEMNVKTVQRAGQFETSLSTESGDRQKVLIDALMSIEDRLSDLIQKVLNQNARSSGPSFNSDDFFNHRLQSGGRRLRD